MSRVGIIAEKANKRNTSARCMASLEQADRWPGDTKSPPYLVCQIGGCYSAAIKTIYVVNSSPCQPPFPT